MDKVTTLIGILTICFTIQSQAGQVCSIVNSQVISGTYQISIGGAVENGAQSNYVSIDQAASAIKELVDDGVCSPNPQSCSIVNSTSYQGLYQIQLGNTVLSGGGSNFPSLIEAGSTVKELREIGLCN